MTIVGRDVCERLQHETVLQDILPRQPDIVGNEVIVQQQVDIERARHVFFRAPAPARQRMDILEFRAELLRRQFRFDADHGIQEIVAFKTQGCTAIHGRYLSQRKSRANLPQRQAHVNFGVEITAQPEKGDGHQVLVR